MARKPTEEQLIRAAIKSDYDLKVQSLMKLVLESDIVKKCEKTTFAKLTKWYVGDHKAVDTSFHVVYSIVDGAEIPTFILNTRDYGKFVKACKAQMNGIKSVCGANEKK